MAIALHRMPKISDNYCAILLPDVLVIVVKHIHHRYAYISAYHFLACPLEMNCIEFSQFTCMTLLLARQARSYDSDAKALKVMMQGFLCKTSRIPSQTGTWTLYNDSQPLVTLVWLLFRTDFLIFLISVWVILWLHCALYSIFKPLQLVTGNAISCDITGYYM